jgi:DNA polymerase-4
MDRFYCTVEEKHNPSLKNTPFAVCGDPEMRHSIVMSASNLARQYGVRAGLRFSDARRLCPALRYVTADYQKYLPETKTAREVYLKYADTIIPYGLDESWLNLEDGVSLHEAEQIAKLIKLEIMYSMGLSASVGVSHNLIFSKIGSDYQKPNGLTVITKENYKQIIWQLPVKKLLFVGQVREKMLTECGIKTIGDIAAADPMYLTKILKSKVGYDLWAFANGDDSGFHPEDDKIGSIGNTITPPKDLRSNDEVSAVIYMLASAVCARLKKHRLKTRCVAINLKDSKFNTTTRQCTLEQATDSKNRIFNRAFELFKNNYSWINPLRSIGVRAASLDDGTQMSLFDSDEHDNIDIDISSQIKRLTERFGKLGVENAGALGRW